MFVHLGRGIHIEQAQIPAGAKVHRIVPMAWSDAEIRQHLANKSLTGGNPPLYAWLDSDDTLRHPVTCIIPLEGTLHETLATRSLRCIEDDEAPPMAVTEDPVLTDDN